MLFFYFILFYIFSLHRFHPNQYAQIVQKLKQQHILFTFYGQPADEVRYNLYLFTIIFITINCILFLPERRFSSCLVYINKVATKPGFLEKS